MQFTELLVSHGRDYAKENQKDFARDVVRYVRNGRLLQILSALGADVSRLETSVNWLGLECHPEDVPDFKPDLVAIRASLERLELALSSGMAGGGAAEPLPSRRPLPCQSVTTSTFREKPANPSIDV